MAATGQLSRLADTKAALRYRISVRRVVCAGYAERALVPLGWIDQLRDRWARASPWLRFAAAPAGWWLFRRSVKRRGVLSSLWRWAPVAWRVARQFDRSRPAN